MKIDGRVRELALFRFCPRCGWEGLEMRGNKSVLCPDCGYVYYHNCASATAVIIETEAGVLFERRTRAPQAGMLDLPGGFVDYGESAEEALLREVREELGLDIALSGYLGSWPNRYVYREVTYYTTDIVFTASLPGDQLARIQADRGEVSEVVLMPADGLNLEQVAFVSMRAALQEWLRRRRR